MLGMSHGLEKHLLTFVFSDKGDLNYIFWVTNLRIDMIKHISIRFRLK